MPVAGAGFGKQNCAGEARATNTLRSRRVQPRFVRIHIIPLAHTHLTLLTHALLPGEGNQDREQGWAEALTQVGVEG